MTSRVAAVMKTRHSTQFDIHTMEDLGHQSVVKYGVLDASAIRLLPRFGPVRKDVAPDDGGSGDRFYSHDR